MSENDIDLIYEFIIRSGTQAPSRIAFYGGEPLIKYSLIQYAIERARDIWPDIRFPITTNAVTLSPERIDWLIDNNTELTISIDGPESYHNLNRVDKNGRGSFDKVKKSIKYIKQFHPNYLNELSLQMTLNTFANLDEIAKGWNDDEVLHDIAPNNIHGVAANPAQEQKKVRYKDVRDLYLHLLNIYFEHPEWLVLRTFFEQIYDNWNNRPILEVNEPVPMPTCMPVNTKLYIDSDLNIGVCEKMADIFRIGSINECIDWDKANHLVTTYYNRRSSRCLGCSAVRFCRMCLTTLEHSPENWDVLCHNERVYNRASMFIFCEMVERGMNQ